MQRGTRGLGHSKRSFMRLVPGRTIHVKDDTLGARLQKEQHALAEGVVLGQQAHKGVVPGLLGNPGRYRDAVELAL